MREFKPCDKAMSVGGQQVPPPALFRERQHSPRKDIYHLACSSSQPAPFNGTRKRDVKNYGAASLVDTGSDAYPDLQRITRGRVEGN